MTSSFQYCKEESERKSENYREFISGFYHDLNVADEAFVPAQLVATTTTTTTIKTPPTSTAPLDTTTAPVTTATNTPLNNNSSSLDNNNSTSELDKETSNQAQFTTPIRIPTPTRTESYFLNKRSAVELLLKKSKSKFGKNFEVFDD